MKLLDSWFSDTPQSCVPMQRSFDSGKIQLRNKAIHDCKSVYFLRACAFLTKLFSKFITCVTPFVYVFGRDWDVFYMSSYAQLLKGMNVLNIPKCLYHGMVRIHIIILSVISLRAKTITSKLQRIWLNTSILPRMLMPWGIWSYQEKRTTLLLPE